MKEIKCPKCGQVFSIDESEYASLLSQVRNDEFENELHKREEQLKKTLDSEKQLDLEKLNNSHQKNVDDLKHQLEDANNTIKSMRESKDNDIKLALSRREQEIAELRNQLTLKDKEKEIEVNKATSKANEDKEKIISDLKQKLNDTNHALEEEKRTSLTKIQIATGLKEREITKLQGQLDLVKQEKESEIKEAVREKENKIKDLTNQLNNSETAKQLEIKNLVENHKKELQQKDEVVNYYKDLKTRMSTKLVGETLEQHCEIEFNKIRMAGYKNATFVKDNVVVEGSKGDYIFRDFDENGTEIVSIMFDMKNENDTTATKHKNEDFLDKLDKDRKKKNCEYAVLVSMLEAENEYYNAGIVDVSYRYPKMYVVRPQCFTAIIALLRDASLNSVQYKNELALLKNQEVDVTTFENRLSEFKNSFDINAKRMNDHYDKAITEINNTIDHLVKVRENLLSASKNLSIANSKAQDLTIRKLTFNNPTMKAKFEEVKKDENDE